MDELLLLPGDGRGPEMMDTAAAVIRAVADDVEISTADIGNAAYEKYGEFLPYETLDAVSGHSVILSGPVANVKDGGAVSNPLAMVMEQLDFFARSRTFASLSDDIGAPGLYMTVWGSNATSKMEIYETEEVDGITISKYIRSTLYERMMTAALADLRRRGLDRAACLAREDIFPMSSQLFYDTFERVFGGDGVSTACQNVRPWMMHAVRHPSESSFLVVSDLYSTVVESMVSGLAGGDHLFPTRYVSDDGILVVPGRREAVPLEEGQRIGPVSSVLTAAEAFSQLGRPDDTRRVIGALRETISAGERTEDLGGTLTWGEFTGRVVSRLRTGFCIHRGMGAA